MEYITSGFTILRDVIPAALLADLRRESDMARILARRVHGQQAQRLQPVYAYDELDPRPFRDFLNLPEMQATVLGILGPDHRQTDIMGVLLEPQADPWCTHWHRDWGYNAAHVDLEEFFAAITDLRMFNQINAALYDDRSLWVVPGSHNRRDSADEREVFPTVPPAAPSLPATMGAVERELTCLEYARSMPCATPVTLFAGDVAFYRACQWHLGSYVPYARRATLHDGFYGPADTEWQQTVKRRAEQARAEL